MSDGDFRVREFAEPTPDLAGRPMTPREMLATMGIDPDEAAASNELSKRSNGRSRTICICGHPTHRHSRIEGTSVVSCRPNRSYCPCQRALPVIEASDLRSFTRRSTGAGRKHALSAGIASALDRESAVVRWVVPLRCAQCAASGESGPILPVPLGFAEDGSPFAVEHPSATNTLLCVPCYEALS